MVSTVLRKYVREKIQSRLTGKKTEYKSHLCKYVKENSVIQNGSEHSMGKQTGMGENASYYQDIDGGTTDVNENPREMICLSSKKWY